MKKLFNISFFLLLIYGFCYSSDLNTIIAGVALFLFGMNRLEKGFKLLTGGFLENFLEKSTDHLSKSVSLGIVSTAILQSSSLISVIVISFLSAGLLGLKQGIGIIFGANLGSTISVWLIALYGVTIKLNSYAMPVLAIGVIFMLQDSKKLYKIGMISLGIGFLLFAISLMKEGFDSFANAIDLTRYRVEGIKGIFVYALIGIFATTVMQSTNATMVLVISALSTGQISYENAIGLTIGSNIGTTVTAIIGALSANIQGKRLAAAHLMFNIVSATISIIFLPFLIDFINLVMINYTPNESLKLAVFHSLFNVIGIVLLLPFIHHLILFLTKIFIQDVALELDNNTLKHVRSKYLNLMTLSYPDSALRAMTKECDHLYRNATRIICYSVSVDSKKLIQLMDLESLKNITIGEESKYSVKELYNYKIKTLYNEIVQYSNTLQATLNNQQNQELFSLKVACRNFIQAVKHTKYIQKHMSIFLKSENIYIKNIYNELRFYLTMILKQIKVLGVKRNYHHIGEHLQKFRKDLIQYDAKIHDHMKELIQTQKIDPYMTTSLMSDSVHIRDACTYLIEGVIIMLTRDKEKYYEFDLSQKANKVLN